MRTNTHGKAQVERFVKAVAGKPLSVRDIGLLAKAYFRGPSPCGKRSRGARWDGRSIN